MFSPSHTLCGPQPLSQPLCASDDGCLFGKRGYVCGGNDRRGGHGVRDEEAVLSGMCCHSNIQRKADNLRGFGSNMMWKKKVFVCVCV